MRRMWLGREIVVAGLPPLNEPLDRFVSSLEGLLLNKKLSFKVKLGSQVNTNQQFLDVPKK